MKRFIEGFLAVCVLAACASLFAQTAPARRTAPPPAKEAAGPKEPVKTAARSIEGFNKTRWGDSLNSVKNNVLGKITYTDEKKIITSRDGDIEYLYGFFVRESAPAAGTGETAAAAWLGEAVAERREAATLRRWLMAPLAAPPDAGKPRGRILCNCLDVAEADIAAAIAEGAGLCDLASLQARLGCGTGCGACVPEISRMLAEPA